jgi:DNA-binding response OmpR family regulator
MTGTAEPAASATVATQCRTLVVEDDESSCSALVKILRRKGHDVDCAMTLKAAFEKLEEFRPECVLLDLMLPDGSGLDFLRKVREENLPVRVAVVTGVGDTDFLEHVLRLRPDGFFQKPVDMYQMLSWLQSAAPPGGDRPAP